MNPNKVIEQAYKMKNRLITIHQLQVCKWLLGYELVTELKQSMFYGNTINEESFLGIPYIIDYKEKDTVLIATDPLNKK